MLDITKAHLRRHSTTVHWSDEEFYQMVRSCPSRESHSEFIRKVVAEWANAHGIVRRSPPDRWYRSEEE